MSHQFAEAPESILAEEDERDCPLLCTDPGGHEI